MGRDGSTRIVANLDNLVNTVQFCAFCVSKKSKLGIIYADRIREGLAGWVSEGLHRSREFGFLPTEG